MVDVIHIDAMQIKLTLCWVKPKVTRVLIVPAMWMLSDLHKGICQAMGWEGRGKEEFCVIENGYDRVGVSPDEEDEVYWSMLNYISLEDMFSSTKKMLYRYDIDDDWEHIVELEKRFKFPGSMAPCCIDGINASPPEDIGGPDEYRKFCRVMAKHTHKLHVQLVQKYGSFDPSKFDPELIAF